MLMGISIKILVNHEDFNEENRVSNGYQYYYEYNSNYYGK